MNQVTLHSSESLDSKPDGIILVDKPGNMTSFGVVARVRRVLSQKHGKRIKVGHTGTLDPFATGLIILTVGSECKKAQFYSKKDKIYQAKIKLGETSSTGDPEGVITKESSPAMPSLKQVEQALKQFEGIISQTPPIYSAIKIDGQRAYKLARAGKEVEMPSRQVQVFYIKLLNYKYPYLEIEVKVSSGTYIRSLAEDIGLALNTGAHCTELRRLAVGEWQVSDALALRDIMSQ